MEQPAPRLFDRRFYILCVGTVLFMASFGMVLPELPGILTELGHPDKIGWLVGLFTIGAFVARLFSGRMADSAGRIPVMLIGSVVTLIAGVAYLLVWWFAPRDAPPHGGMSVTVLLLLGIRLFHGLSTGFRPTGATAYLTDITPFARRGEALGFLGVAGNVGMAAGPALGSFLAVEVGYEAMFGAAAVLGLLALLMTLVLEESLPNARRITWQDFNLFQGKLLDFSTWRSSLAMLAPAFAFGAFLTVTPDFVGDLGYTYKGAFNMLAVLASIAMRFVAGKASDRHGRVPLMVLGAWMLAAGMYLLATATDQTSAAIAGVVYGLSVGINMPTVFAWTADMAKPGKIALALGTMLMALELGIGFGAFLSGALYEGVLERIPMIYKMAAAVAAVSGLALSVHGWRLKRGS